MTTLQYTKLNDAEKKLLRDSVPVCPLCDRELTTPVVDHDHDTDVVRGVICNGCNVRLGVLTAFTLEWLQRAAPYIDDKAGIMLRTKLFQIVDCVYRQRHHDLLQEQHQLSARQTEIYTELAKIEKRQEQIRSRLPDELVR
jgi:hypothetical protein